MTALWGALLLAAAGTPSPVEAPVTAATVFSDRARVTRTATVKLGGRQVVDLPILGGRVDPSSIRLESGDADVLQVDIARVDADDAFPRDEARKVLAELDAVDAAIARARRDHGIHAGLDVLAALDPEVPRGDPLKAPPKLNASGWSAAIAFARSWSERMSARARDLTVEIEDLGRKRAALAERAAELGARRRTGGWRVRATVTGKGDAILSLSYFVSGARWYPTYDIQLDPVSQKVEVGFAAEVSQESGEDWVDARLILSTAVPATATSYPKVTTWKIGERERFIPKPAPAPEQVAPPPPAAPPPAAVRDEDDKLRRTLATRARAPREVDVLEKTVDELRERVYRTKARMSVAKEREASKQEADVPLDSLLESASGAPSVDSRRRDGATPTEPPAAPPAPAAAASAQSYQDRSTDEEETVEVSERRPSRGRTMAASADQRRSYQRTPSAGSTTPTQSFGIAPPPGWQRPYLAPDLPAMLAGGYDLTYRAAGAETVRSGKGARRVALFGRSFPVQVERRVFPDLAPEAYLVAEIRNPTGQPLPGGQAKLFVGADPAGVARLKTVAAGETFTLPLGIDHAVRPIRNVKVVTTESGLISKEEASEYTVTIEIANPMRSPIAVRVVDQVPVTDNKDLEAKFVRATPAYADYDKVKGRIEWRLAIPAAGKSTVTFVYSLKRPKGYRLRQ